MAQLEGPISMRVRFWAWMKKESNVIRRYWVSEGEEEKVEAAKLKQLNGFLFCFLIPSSSECGDEQYFVFGKMHGFSTVDGFVEIGECMAEMIKYVANEPSAGLFFIQQHTQNAVPNVVKLKNSVTDKSHETTLQTEDLEDSITMVRSMKECGFSIAGEMIGDIKKSLVTITANQQKRGRITRSSSKMQSERTSFWGNSAVDAQEGSEKRSNYFSGVFKFSKQKSEKSQLYPSAPLSVTSANVTASSQGMEAENQPLSNQVEDESQAEQGDAIDIGNKLLSVSVKYDDFKAIKEAKLEEWLEGAGK